MINTTNKATTFVTGLSRDTLRIIPPINVSASEVDEALAIFGAALDSAAK